MKKSSKFAIILTEFIISIILGIATLSCILWHYGKYFIFDSSVICYRLGNFGGWAATAIFIELSLIFFLIFHTVSEFLIKIYEDKHKPKFEVTDYNVFEDVRSADDYDDGFYQTEEGFNNSGIKTKKHNIKSVAVIFFLITNIIAIYFFCFDITIFKNDCIIQKEISSLSYTEYSYEQIDDIKINKEIFNTEEIVLKMNDNKIINIKIFDFGWNNSEYLQGKDTLNTIKQIIDRNIII